MKITISVGGKWCAFEQAEQLARMGVLDRIITSYPRYRVSGYDLARTQIETIFFPELVYQVMRRLPSFVRGPGVSDCWKAVLFDRLVARRLTPCDIFIGWAVFALESMRIAKSLGAVGCVERGSAHILTQEELLAREYRRWGLKKPLLHPGLLERQMAEYEEADFIIVQSSFAYESFVQRGVDPERLLKISLGVDTRWFKPHEKRDDIFRVLFVGAITVRKGVLDLLKAFRRAKLPKSELVFIGGLDSEVRSLLGQWDGSCRFVGHVPHENLPRWYSQASVFVAPSIEDGFGQVILEAMSCGVPTIASTHSCGPDVIRDGVEGYCVPPGDSKILADRLSFLYEHPGRLAEMRRAARRRAVEFSWERYGEIAVKTFSNILKSKNGNENGLKDA